jgi:hypothetical protein
MIAKSADMLNPFWREIALKTNKCVLIPLIAAGGLAFECPVIVAEMGRNGKG